VARIDEDLPVVGQETAGMGERADRRSHEVDVLRLGVELGMSLIGTAEYYAAGRAELVVADAIHDIRSRVFLVDMVYPRHPTLESTRRAARASLRRTGAGYFDLLLVHWPTAEFRADLMALSMMYVEGVARYIGVSNFSLPWLVRAEPALPRDTPVAANRLPYSLLDRRIEEGFLDELNARGILVMAYGPLAHGTVVRGRRARVLAEVAAPLGATPAQVALAWTVRAPGVVALPRAVTADHVRENAGAGELVLGAEALARLDEAFLAPPRPYRPDLPAWRPLFRWAYDWEAMRTARRSTPGGE
jgi:diketogulonate reductase-like aldo/keto reductase